MTDFITHDSNEPPLLPPAVLVVILAEERRGLITPTGPWRADNVTWRSGLEYRPLTDPEGHPYVSAEGLEEWAEWVATSYGPWAHQYSCRPWADDDGEWWANGGQSGPLATNTNLHIHPGNWRESLYRVWREGRNPMTDNTPPPGSDDAVKQGCQCPVMDNCFGEGWMGDSTSYWIDEDCPLHGQEGEPHD